jgi:DNA primase
MASGDSVQQIKDRLSIVDVIAPYVELKPAGKSLKGKSPFTNEKTPSFHVSPDRGMYYCFSSSQGGDMFTFVEKMEGVDFKGALKILADKAGVELTPVDPKAQSERDELYAALDTTTTFFERSLAGHDEARAYLKDRGVKPETRAAWRLGYAPGPPSGGWRELRLHLQAAGYTDARLRQAGLIKDAGQGKEPYDVFRDRVMFPIMDPSGRVIAFSGRQLTPSEKAPKYLNSPDTDVFHKSEALYGYHQAKEGIRKLDFSLIVEGQFDVVLAHQAGYTNTVAVSGTALTEHHVGLLQRLSGRVVLALDADRAGVAAVKRAAAIMLPRGVDLKVATLPVGKDPADLISEDITTFKQVIGGSKHVIEFLLEVLKAEAKDERSYKLRARDEVLPYLLQLPSHVDRDHFVGVVAEALGVQRESVVADVERLEEQASARPTATPVQESTEDAPPLPGATRAERLQHYLTVAYELLPDGLQTPLATGFSEVTGEDIKKARDEVPASVASELLFTLEAQFAEMKPVLLAAELRDALIELNQHLISTKLRTEKDALAASEAAGDETTAEQHLTTITALQQQLADTEKLRRLFDKVSD